MLNEIKNANISFDQLLSYAMSLPMVKIDREKYLLNELKLKCSDEQIKQAIAHNPAYAGISLETIDQISKNAINIETGKVTAISTIAGIPGGFAMIGTIPADIAQYLGHLLRILQKLAYLYGWDELVNDETDAVDDETKALITIFLGIMFGVHSATTAINKIAISAAQVASKKIATQALTKTIYYPIIKKIAHAIGVKMTRELFAKSVSKAIPIIGGIASGGITYATFKPMSNKLKNHLSKMKFCDVDFYAKAEQDAEDNSVDEEIIEVSFSE